MNSTMNVLKIMPGRKPEQVVIPHTLEAMQQLVSGSIQAIYPYMDNVALVCNEEGKILGLEPNRAVYDEDTGDILDIISGTFFICGLSADDFCSLTSQQLERYSTLFRHPEAFFWNGSSLVILHIDME